MILLNIIKYILAPQILRFRKKLIQFADILNMHINVHVWQHSHQFLGINTFDLICIFNGINSASCI